MDETEIIQRCKRGERESYVTLFTDYRDGSYRYCMGMMGDHQDSLDIVQEAFLAAFRGIERLDAQRGFASWFYGILRHLCLASLRQRKYEIGSEAIAQMPDRKPSPEAIASAVERREALAVCLNQLTLKQREVILLREFEDLAYNEIAIRLDVAQGTVMSRLYDARQALRRLLQLHPVFSEESAK